MFITIINDCRDENAAGRQLTRVAALFGVSGTLVGVDDYADLEAAGNLVDVLDAGDGREGVVLVNVAPRHGAGKRWENGTPFGYFRYGKTLVVSTVDGLALSLMKKFGVANEVRIVEIPPSLDVFVEKEVIGRETAERIRASQFRSFDFAPRLAHALWSGVDVPFTGKKADAIAESPTAVWFVDNFGNCKTTLLERDLPEGRGVLQTAFGDLQRYPSLKDVPDGQAAIIRGSSGIGNDRFLEIVVQGKSAARMFNLSAGSIILS